MMSRRMLFASAATLLLTASSPALAGDAKPFTDADFAASQEAGEPILIAIHANWCPVCKVQEPIVARLHDQPKFRKMTIYRVDYDSQKDVVKRLGARMQSTLVTFKGKTETGRSAGDTDAKSIEALLSKAL
jgi:thioredoxin 1